jgi:hypothetical protein
VRERVSCLRCGAHRDLAVLPAHAKDCLICGHGAYALVPMNLADLDAAILETELALASLVTRRRHLVRDRSVA